MPHVYLPPTIRSLAGGREVVEASGTTVRELIEDLDAAFSGIKERLMEAGTLRPGISVSVNGSISSLGLLERVEPDAEVHFLPALGGG